MTRPAKLYLAVNNLHIPQKGQIEQKSRVNPHWFELYQTHTARGEP